MSTSDPNTARKRWMRLCALAKTETLEAALPALGDDAGVNWLRPPETGMVMVQGRIGGGGAPFNLGEMPVTRCALALADGTVGHAYVAGRDHRKARAAALVDALMQRPETAPQLERELLAPLAAAIAGDDTQEDRKTAATRVDFFTMVRGD
jgi:alpha-D-ribose 1-methylphosphonate 5-triphosphate synthase subunit PhnG